MYDWFALTFTGEPLGKIFEGAPTASARSQQKVKGASHTYGLDWITLNGSKFAKTAFFDLHPEIKIRSRTRVPRAKFIKMVPRI